MRFWRQLHHHPLVAPFSSRQLSHTRTECSDFPRRILERRGLEETELRLDPHNYTGGRWLHRDELQRNARRMMFDFSALCERATRFCPGATRVVHCEKKEGRCNRVFLLTMNTGSRVVARLPTSISGPPRLTTNSEVATMAYLRGKISLPIPDILDWSDDPSNPIGTEYII
ncbi:hypothetical protein P168DRAFT_334752 [Aspergillus campestris IBT 28561]|uniref:Altered inheritance of mitochondria protein 9, mitochondrial n=1 Tax=Aspergillus campestris (strain IBT 28561) TaxID=1392248 RepID=A0A2I1CW10_ASPC2|nr:uncharacterized protein P168DRAFT_334752 [Aspergillus campestris IBT 28561]PKY01810.1 hypothetical protein P168DRAFT_334752 [Aspergillus campestris IBT 28561]